MFGIIIYDLPLFEIWSQIMRCYKYDEHYMTAALNGILYDLAVSGILSQIYVEPCTAFI